MAQTIYIKNSELAGATPSSLNKGEIAINISDGNLFYGDAGGNVSQNFSFLNSGATSIGALTATSGTFRSNVNISGDTHFPDNAKALFGTDIDLKIYHSGSHSIIQDTGVGDLHVKGSIVKIKGTSTGEDCAVFTENGSVELYYDNAKKLETASGGINIGSLAAGAVVTTGEEGLLTSSDFLTWNVDTSTLTSLNIVVPEDGVIDTRLGTLNTSAAQNLDILQGAAANVDIGAYTIRASTLRSDVATGTAPITVASTTVVANLHATSATSVMTNANLTGDITSVGNATSFNGAIIVNADVNASAAIDYSKLAALSDGNILVGNGSNVATSVNPSGDIDVTNAGVFSIASGVIIDADVKSDAAIVQTKIDTNVDLGGNITFGTQPEDVVTFTGPLSSNTRYSATQHILRSSTIYINTATVMVINSLYMGHTTGNQPYNWNDPQASGGVLSEVDTISIAEDDMRWGSILPFDISQVDIQCSIRPNGACTGDDFFLGLYTADRVDCGGPNMTITKVAQSQDLLCQSKYTTNDLSYVGNLDKGTLIFIGIGSEDTTTAKNAPGLLNVTITQR